MPVGDSLRIRAVLVVLLLALQGGMALDYGAYRETCPNDPECFAKDYDRYVGERYRVGGFVVGTDPTVIAVEYAPEEALELRLLGFDAPVSTGDRVSVYGEFAPDRAVRVEEYIVHERANRLYMFGVSAGAILLVYTLGLRAWRFDPRALVFRRRGD